MPRTDSLDLNEINIVLQYFMSKLSEPELSELDDMLVPEKGADPSSAMDARPAPYGGRRSDWIRQGPANRIQARDARTAKLATDEKASSSLHEQFPNLNRLRG